MIIQYKIIISLSSSLRITSVVCKTLKVEGCSILHRRRARGYLQLRIMSRETIAVINVPDNIAYSRLVECL